MCSNKMLNSVFAIALWMTFGAATVNAQMVPPGTDVVVKTIDTMSSKVAKTGDKFVVEVADDVVVNGQMLIPAGTRGSGTILFARAKHGGGVSGALDVRIDYVDAPSGRIKLKANDINRGSDRRNAGTTAGLMFGFIGYLSVQGEEKILPPGTKIAGVVATPRVAATANMPAVVHVAAETPVEKSVETATSTAETPITTNAEESQKENK